jgi:hypothetical protein
MRHVVVPYRVKPALGERCDEPPVVTELQEIGSYHVLGEERVG